MSTLVLAALRRCFFLLVLCAGIAHAQVADTFPERPITLICPWTPGGNTDIALRALADVAARNLGKRIVIDNRPGAGGALGPQNMAASAKPDGYTLSQIPLGVFRLPHMVKTAFDPLADLTWILNVAGYEFGVSVRADAPWKTWDEFIAYAKANPGKVSFSSPGIGTSLHLTMEDLSSRLGIQWLHVPYKGSADAVTALRGGQVMAQAGSPPWELVEAGQARPLVMWGDNRTPRAPNVPTLKELYGIVANSPWGIAGPKGMDARVVKILHDAFRRAMDDPVFIKALDRVGMAPYYMAGEDYLQWARRAAEEEKRAVERLGLKP
jgi:tripartite-type tricarboxylate transporter receptor subunit TctC